MKYIITIPASIRGGKKPVIIPAQYHLTEAFNQLQAERRAMALISGNAGMTIQPLDDWIKAIPSL
jgi:CBS domain containing-hemolysin-like protein